ncbi:DUF4097 family beta strand repeat-containing protein [Pyrococcus horikoshii]|uniref:DUF4097 domain-containing protein n=2 Tax=Pyrococcus horikoshii TaxID=53953 RepID=O58826_PYRHO|nr:DUF4097 domain-containing protein [Pyrococcus horikoshii]BAA30198.1 208aa long hypothetical protein [Pyrococcus horikoshii OT3]HII61860.1 DUF4097 domain-containing protein [Pyrococcus horikoshii]
MIFYGIKRVIVSSVNGSIRVKGSNIDYVKLEYEIQGDADVRIEREEDTLIIKEKLKRRWILGILGRDGKVNISLTVPSEVEVEITSVNGPIRAENCRITGIKSTNSSITLKDAKIGKVHTVNGTVRGSVKLTEEPEVKTVNGNIDLKIYEIEGDGKISTVNGGVNLTIMDDVKINAKTVTGKIEVPPMEGVHELRIATVNGSITVEKA